MIPVDSLRVAKQKGSVMVEYALVLGVFMMIVFGIVQFSLILFGFNNATYASRLAIRYAVVHGSTSKSPVTSAQIQSMIAPLLWGAPSGGYSITTVWSPNNTPGSAISINVTIQYLPALPFYPSRTFTVGTTAYGRILQ